jgi:hypothetical protein
MRVLMAAALLAAVGCGDSGIVPEPQQTSSSGNSMGGDGQGGAQPNGGAPAGGEAPVGGNGPNGGSTPGGGFESGSRIKARTLVGDDGARSPAGWFDSALSVECTWRRMTNDSTTRCVPAFAASSYFADSACMQPLVLASSCSLPQHGAITDGCGGVRIFPIGAPVSPPLVYFFSGTCVNVAAPAGQFYSLGAEMEPDAFVSATLETED